MPELLEHVTGLDAEELLRNLEPAVAAGLVTASGTGWGFRFRHPLIQESLHASAGHLERARLHARIAAALEELSGGQAAADQLAQIAYHYLSAGPFGDAGKAVSYARQAAEHAVKQGAWQDAIRHLTQALAAISPAKPHPDGIRCDVLLELGRAYRSASKVREAHGCFKEAISLADRADDGDRRLAAAVAFGRPALWGSRAWGESDQQLIGLLERELGRVAPDDPRRVRILSTLAMELSDTAIERGWTLALESLHAARALGRADELGLAVSACLYVAVGADHLPERRAILDEALAGQLGELTPLVTALLHASMLTERIRFAELARFDAEFPTAWRLAAELRTPELLAQLRFVQAGRYLAAGDIELGTGSAIRGFETMTNVTVTWLHRPASHWTARPCCSRARFPSAPRSWPPPSPAPTTRRSRTWWPPPLRSATPRQATWTERPRSPGAGSPRRPGPGRGRRRSPTGRRLPSRPASRTRDGCTTSCCRTPASWPSSGRVWTAAARSTPCWPDSPFASVDRVRRPSGRGPG